VSHGHVFGGLVNRGKTPGTHLHLVVRVGSNPFYCGEI
ncbi:MAG: hypothetical protein RL097_555, partial [Candidatus Parcubacteria bacterium]